jgi:integrase
MAIEKRTWKNADGSLGTSWRVTIGSGKNRETATFERKKEADDYVAGAKVNIKKGIHLAPSKSPTVKEAGKSWIEACEANNLEQTSIDAYQNHLDLHIYPYLGEFKLASLTIAVVRQWQDDLKTGKPAPGQEAAERRSADMVKRCTGSLGALLADAMERGHVAQNVVRNLKANRRRGKERQAERRIKGKLVVGVDIPTPEEIKAILAVAEDDKTLLLVFIRCGLRSSEIRGLRWSDIDLDRALLHVRQRADRYNAIGAPKSEAGDRSIPIPPSTLAALREWKLRCPRRANGELHYVFPNGAGNVENRGNIVNRRWHPVQVRAGVTVPVLDVKGKQVRGPDGKRIVAAKYTGLHALRHYFASWCINPPPAGLGLPPKAVQERLGHSSITMTMDTYGHLFPRGNESDALAAAESEYG